MQIQVVCPKCNAKYSVKRSLLRKKLKCKCGVIFEPQTSSVKDAVEQSQIQFPAGFWDEKFSKIDDGLSEEQEKVTREDSHSETEADFEVVLPMDPFTGGTYYIVQCIFTGIILLPLTIPLAFLWMPLPLIAIFVFTFGVFIYRIRVHYANQMIISIGKYGVSIRYQKKLPWPCWNRYIPSEAIEDVNIECNTVKRTPLMPNAEYSHTTHTSKTTYTYVFVYDLKCKLKNSPWSSRLATIVDRSIAKAMRPHLKRMLKGNGVDNDGY
ncbi:MAG: hypothetical protein ACK52S_08945 [Pirellula sp.]